MHATQEATIDCKHIKCFVVKLTGKVWLKTIASMQYNVVCAKWLKETVTRTVT